MKRLEAIRRKMERPTPEEQWMRDVELELALSDTETRNTGLDNLIVLSWEANRG